MVSKLAVFLRSITPKLPALYATLVSGRLKDGLHEAGSMVSFCGLLTAEMLQDDPDNVILLPAAHPG